MTLQAAVEDGPFINNNIGDQTEPCCTPLSEEETNCFFPIFTRQTLPVWLPAFQKPLHLATYPIIQTILEHRKFKRFRRSYRHILTQTMHSTPPSATLLLHSPNFKCSPCRASGPADFHPSFSLATVSCTSVSSRESIHLSQRKGCLGSSLHF